MTRTVNQPVKLDDPSTWKVSPTIRLSLPFKADIKSEFDEPTPSAGAAPALAESPIQQIVRGPSGPPPEADRVIRFMVDQLGQKDCVYFIGFNIWVKIGFSSQIWDRLEKLDCMPEPVTLLALIPGGRGLERRLHDRFLKYHTNAEWFTNEGGLAEHIQTLRDDAERALR